MVVEVDTLAMGGVDDASVGVDEAIIYAGDVDAAADVVDVAATCASTGLTMANPITGNSLWKDFPQLAFSQKLGILGRKCFTFCSNFLFFLW